MIVIDWNAAESYVPGVWVAAQRPGIIAVDVIQAVPKRRRPSIGAPQEEAGDSGFHIFRRLRS